MELKLHLLQKFYCLRVDFRLAPLCRKVPKVGHSRFSMVNDINNKGESSKKRWRPIRCLLTIPVNQVHIHKQQVQKKCSIATFSHAPRISRREGFRVTTIREGAVIGGRGRVTFSKYPGCNPLRSPNCTSPPMFSLTRYIVKTMLDNMKLSEAFQFQEKDG